MKDKVTLTMTSVLSVLLFALHWADEVSRGMEAATLSALGGIAILVVWLSGTLVLGDRRSGYVITLIGGIFGLGVLILHMTGPGMIAGRIPANSSGAFFWVLTLIALGVISTISAILAARGLWSMRRGQSQRSTTN
jgi:hypothetical protein